MRLIAMMVFAAGIAHANSDFRSLDDAQREGLEHCHKVSEFAENVMQGRQAGDPMAEPMSFVFGTPWAEELVIKAYQEPIGTNASARQRAVFDFRDESYLACIKRLKGTH